MQQWRLRTGGEVDVEAMYRLDLLCFEEPFRFDLQTMRRFVLERGAVVVVAEVGEALAGFVVVNREGKGAYVTTLDVDVRLRRAGLARRLMEEAQGRVKAGGAAWVGLHVYAGNEGAVRFYEEIGYERVGMEVGFYGEGMDGWVYRKRL